MKDKIRIASGQGFWGDLQSAPYDQVSKGPIDYIMMDFLAEVTMSIMQKQKHRNPELGYAKDYDIRAYARSSSDDKFTWYIIRTSVCARSKYVSRYGSASGGNS